MPSPSPTYARQVHLYSNTKLSYYKLMTYCPVCRKEYDGTPEDHLIELGHTQDPQSTARYLAYLEGRIEKLEKEEKWVRRG
jgi:hypothetical protein